MLALMLVMILRLGDVILIAPSAEWRLQVLRMADSSLFSLLLLLLAANFCLRRIEAHIECVKLCYCVLFITYRSPIQSFALNLRMK